jgi:ribonuclease III
LSDPIEEAPLPPDITDPIARLEERLGHRFADGRLLHEALTHRSYVNETSVPDVRDNERLEFLGDAVIDLVVSEELMRRYPRAREGRLSKVRASLVSEPGLAKLAELIGLGEALRLGRGEELSGGRSKASILADTFEALIAALYLDAGIDRVRAVLLACLAIPAEDEVDRADPKTDLQQRIQAERHLTPTYRLLEERGPDHDKTFVVEIVVGAEALATGEGRTKKEAEQRAAAKVLAELDTGPLDPGPIDAAAIDSGSLEATTDDLTAS